MSNEDYNSDARVCQNCGSNRDQCLEDLENDNDFEVPDESERDYDTRNEYMQGNLDEREKNHEDESTVLCLECYEASHDTHWHAMHPEY